MTSVVPSAKVNWNQICITIKHLKNFIVSSLTMQTLVWSTPTTNDENLKKWLVNNTNKYFNNNYCFTKKYQNFVDENSVVFILIFFYANVTFVKLWFPTTIEIPGQALVLIPILPTLTGTFHQNTNSGLTKQIGVYFHFKYYHNLILSHPKSCVYFQSVSLKDI